MLPNWIGALPETPSIVTVATSGEFEEHGAAFIRSVFENKMDCHIHLINPSDTCHRGIYKLIEGGENRLTVTFEDNETGSSGLVDYDQVKMRTFNVLLGAGNPLFFVCVDSIINKPIVFPEKGKWLCLSKQRENISMDTFFATEEASEIISHIFVFSRMNTSAAAKQEFVNYLDREYLEQKEPSYERLPDNIMSHDCDEESFIWKSNGSEEYAIAKKKYGSLLSKQRKRLK